MRNDEINNVIISFILLGSPLRRAQSSDCAGLSPPGFLSLLGFDERNLRAQHPQLLEKGSAEGTGRGQGGGSSDQDTKNCFLSGPTATLQREVAAETMLRNFGENPSPVLTLFQTFLGHQPLIVQIFDAFSKHCASKHLPSSRAVATLLSWGCALNLSRIPIKKSALPGDFYCCQVSKC